MSLTFEAREHAYFLDGASLPSVTQVLSASGLVDFSGIPRFILEAAQLRGTTVHAAAHYYNERDLDVDGFQRDFPDYYGYLASWVSLAKTGRLRPVLCEHRIASRRHGFAGTIDWIGEFDGSAAIIDYATGNPADVAKDYQTGAYLMGAREWATEPGQDVLREFLAKHKYIERFSARLRKNGEMPTLARYSDPRDFARFITLLDAQKIVRARRPNAIKWEDFAA